MNTKKKKELHVLALDLKATFEISLHFPFLLWVSGLGIGREAQAQSQSRDRHVDFEGF